MYRCQFPKMLYRRAFAGGAWSLPRSLEPPRASRLASADRGELPLRRESTARSLVRSLVLPRARSELVASASPAPRLRPKLRRAGLELSGAFSVPPRREELERDRSPPLVSRSPRLLDDRDEAAPGPGCWASLRVINPSPLRSQAANASRSAPDRLAENSAKEIMRSLFRSFRANSAGQSAPSFSAPGPKSPSQRMVPVNGPRSLAVDRLPPPPRLEEEPEGDWPSP